LLALTNLPDRTLNVVLVEDPPGDPGRALAAARKEFSRRGCFFGIDLPDGGFGDVAEAAREAGLRPTATRPAMAASLASVRERRTPEGIRLEAVSDLAGLEAVRQLQVEVFDWSPSVARAFLPERALREDGLRCYVAWEGAKPVATATGHLDHGAIGVFGVGTARAARGRGIASALAGRCVAEAGSGADLAWLQSTPMGRSVYEAMGFRPAGDWVVWT
jgi:predicted GNAT family acetyltransferase